MVFSSVEEGGDWRTETSIRTTVHRQYVPVTSGYDRHKNVESKTAANERVSTFSGAIYFPLGLGEDPTHSGRRCAMSEDDGALLLLEKLGLPDSSIYRRIAECALHDLLERDLSWDRTFEHVRKMHAQLHQQSEIVCAYREIREVLVRTGVAMPEIEEILPRTFGKPKTVHVTAIPQRTKLAA